MDLVVHGTLKRCIVIGWITDDTIITIFTVPSIATVRYIQKIINHALDKRHMTDDYCCCRHVIIATVSLFLYINTKII